MKRLTRDEGIILFQKVIDCPTQLHIGSFVKIDECYYEVVDIAISSKHSLLLVKSLKAEEHRWIAYDPAIVVLTDAHHALTDLVGSVAHYKNELHEQLDRLNALEERWKSKLVVSKSDAKRAKIDAFILSKASTSLGRPKWLEIGMLIGVAYWYCEIVDVAISSSRIMILTDSPKAICRPEPPEYVEYFIKDHELIFLASTEDALSAEVGSLKYFRDDVLHRIVALELLEKEWAAKL